MMTKSNLVTDPAPHPTVATATMTTAPPPAIAIAVIKTGTTYPSLAARRGDFDDWMRQGMNADPHPDFTIAAPTIDVRAGASLPDPATFDGYVVTGSHSMVTDREPWSEMTAAWLRDCVAAQAPVLGICYGHQLLAHATGGTVGPRPELGAVQATLEPAAAGDPLFAGMPPSFPTLNGHFQGVLTLPPGAVRLASTARDPNHAFRLGPAAWGIQFHPEIDVDITNVYLDRSRDDLTALGMDGPTLQQALVPAPDAASMLARFARYIHQAVHGDAGTCRPETQQWGQR